MLSLTSALETLSNANRVAGASDFEWTTYSEDGRPVLSSLESEYPVDAPLPQKPVDGIVLVIGGDSVETHCSPGVLNWLRQQARFGSGIGGLCTGSYVVARAGLLEGKSATIHWHYRDSFAETFANVSLCNRNFLLDSNRYSTAGGISSIDLILELISEQTDSQFAISVAEQMNYGVVRNLQKLTGVGTPDRLAIRKTKVALAVKIMEDNLEDPVCPAKLAQSAGISVRQLERLFRRTLNQSPKQYYMKMRLERARDLLLHSSLAVSEIGYACGFQSSSHFSKCFRRRFQQSPLELRR
ncbi:GlxA family transcriptional regulator [Mameliella alba]|uniref:Transcriptional regulator, AraC family protein n=1 Tax=Mameliella alba TaxID=561184 RepID=A0A0B3RKD7_9RHOB|nr:GlxA family transcriptional regulator [Mameliella alba]KHQ51715.1 Transcriptional regulator, AraC family protein [Mameliella alba]GGF74688.1 AraC family transcriptional regulator [Mameliella alba]